MYRINNNKSGTVNLQPIKDSIAKIEKDTNNISRMLNLTTFIQSGQAMTAGSYFKMDDWLTSPSNSIEIYGIASSGYNTLGFWHTIDNSINLITSSSVMNHSGFTDYKTNGWMNKSRAINLEGYVIDSLTNIGMYPWTDTIYDGYVFKYGLTYSGLRWDMPTLPEKVKSITYSYIFTDAGVSVNPVLSFTKMNDMDYLKFDNVGNSIVSGSYVLSYNGQHVGTMDLINDSAAQFKVQNVKIDELNYSAISNKPLLITNATCGNLNIISPNPCTLSSCELNNIKGHSAAQLLINTPLMVSSIASDINVDNFGSLTLSSVILNKAVNLKNIGYNEISNITCEDLSFDNVNHLKFNVGNHHVNINNLKLNSMDIGEFDFSSASGMIKYGEFKNINTISMTMPTAATFFTDGGLFDNVKSMYISGGFLSNFTINNPEYLQLSKVTVSGGELTAQQLYAQTALIKGIENVSIESLNAASYLTFDGMKNLTINYAPNRGDNLIRNIEKVYFKIIPDFDEGILASSWYIDSLNSTRLNWLIGNYMSASNMTMYTGAQGWFGDVSTFIGDNLYNATNSNYTIKNVNDITINNIEFTGSNGISFVGFVNLDINKINNNINNNITVDGSRLMQNNVNINNFENLNSMRLVNNRQVNLNNGKAYDLIVSGDNQLMGALTLADVEMENADFKNLSYADFGNGSCDEVRISNVLNCEHPFSYCHDVYIDVAHSANLTNYVLNWQFSHVL